MDILNIIAGPLIGSVIGYFTNFIAVKMLFRPLREVKIGNFRLPFTPGIIPKGKERLAKALGAAVGENLLTREDLEKIFFSDSVKQVVVNALMQTVYSEKNRDASLRELLSAHMGGEAYASEKENLENLLCERFQKGIGSLDIVKLINDDRVSTDLDSEAAVGLVNQFRGWVDKGYVNWTTMDSDASSNMRQAFIDGKAFSVVHTSSLYNTYVDKCDFEVGMAWLPGGDTKNQEIGGCVLLIPSKNDQATKNAAWQFLSYLCSKEVNMKWAKETGYIPTRNSVLQTEEGVEFLKEKPAFQCIFDNLDLINPRIQHPGWNQLSTIWKNYMLEIMVEDVDIPSKLEDMVEEINEVLEDA